MFLDLFKLKKSSRQIAPQFYFSGRCPKEMPLGAWKSVRYPVWPIRLAVLPTWAAAVGGFLVLLQRPGLIPSSGEMLELGIAAVIGSTYLCFVHGVRERRFRRLVTELEYEVCLECGYRLSGLPDSHRCPECGSAFNRTSTRETWRKWLDRP